MSEPLRAPREPWRRALLEIVLVAALVASPLLPAPGAALAALVLSVAWLALRDHRERLIAGPLLIVAVVSLIAGWALSRGERAARTEWARETRQEYERLWDGLQGEAEAAAHRVEGLRKSLAATPPAPAVASQAFQRLEDVAGLGKGRRALLLLDPDGVPVAWAGEGLLHELPQELPSSGPYYRASFSAVTLLAIRPLDGSRRPWRIAAGASFGTDALPFPAAHPARWALAHTPAQALPGTDVVTLPGFPALIVEWAPLGSAPQGRPVTDRVAWAALGLALLALAVVRGLRNLLPGAPPPGEKPAARPVTPLVLGGSVALAGVFLVPLPELGVLLAGLGLAALSLQLRHLRTTAGERIPVPVKGGAAALLLLLAAWALQLQRVLGPRDLAAAIVVSAATFALRLGLAGAAFGLLVLAGRRRDRPAAEAGDRWAWIAVALLLAGAASCDQPFVAVPLLAAGGAAAALWADLRRLTTGMALMVLILLSVFAAAGAWETAYRLALRAYAGDELLVRLAPPTRAELAAVAGELHGHFLKSDLQRLVPRTPANLEPQDLAYALWKDSPLARSHALSALVVETPGGLSSFSFGMPLTDQGVADTGSERWESLRLPLWDGLLISGVTPLRLGGRPWGTLRYWLLPRPGFEVHRRPQSEVGVGLLKGGPAAGATEEITGPALYALYTPAGRAVLSPWEEEPPLPARLTKSTGWTVHAVVDTPSGLARAWARVSRQGWEAVYLPFLAPLQGLERMGNWCVGVVALLALAAPSILLLALPRAAFSDLLRRTLRSYSKRLTLIYTVLLLVPLVALYFVLVSSMEERLRRDQQASGEAALSSAQQLLTQELLKPPPGFGVDTAFGDGLLIHLAGIVRHEVNLYWGSAIHSSSRHELF
ncbi:MAG TPA: hypothetical protein VFC23_18560, partial [Thermoanaerobaculia bacterium]|nr:hypothetical protein [Thermoanaerobaculia bacterium]